MATGNDVPASSDDDRSKMLKHGDDMASLDRDTSNSEPCDRSASVSLEKAGERDGTSKTGKGLFSWVTGWMKFGKSDADNVTTNRNVIDEASAGSIGGHESLKASACGSGQQEVHEIFTKSYFWDVLQQQISKPLGSELVSKAKTREELAHQLQKLDCWPLKGLAEKDLHQLVNLLVSEKKWVEETPSRNFPFHLTLPHKRTCIPSNSRKFDGLSTLFSNGKRLQPGKHVSDKSTNSSLMREETLTDCHKLLKDLLLEYEYGFNISIFKLRFAQKYGYELDPQKLGYPDLKSLVQIMPGVRVKFPRVLPAENGNGQAGKKGNGDQSNGDDFVWEELGPVSATAETVEGADKEMCYRPPTLSDDDFSDNENHADQQPRRGTETSSLLQIIDSWHNSKDVSCRKTQDIDGLVDCSRSDHGNADNLTGGDAPRPTRPPHKQYSFVSDSEEHKEKDKLVESVLGSLQKARTSKLHN
uniref:HTH OST-type domain-containing protein n=2 Tax=Oryza brachyantha TaxID=4533 RepID=J3NBN3_ORYBR